LATMGYLKIRQIEERGSIFKSKDYELELLNNDSNRLNEFQKIYADYKQKTIESKKIGKIEVLIVNEKK